nr:hypothetical protein [Mesorhizobium onobrychidis]
MPDDLLEDWFAPGAGMNPVSKKALAAAKTYGWRFACKFKHYPKPMAATMAMKTSVTG